MIYVSFRNLINVRRRRINYFEQALSMTRGDSLKFKESAWISPLFDELFGESEPFVNPVKYQTIIRNYNP